MKTYVVMLRWQAASYIEAETFADGETPVDALAAALEWAADRGLMPLSSPPSRVVIKEDTSGGP